MFVVSSLVFHVGLICPKLLSTMTIVDEGVGKVLGLHMVSDNDSAHLRVVTLSALPSATTNTDNILIKVTTLKYENIFKCVPFFS